MSPKRKASNSPLGGKPDKKGINIKKEKVRAFTEEEDDDNKVNFGKNVIEKGNEDRYFYKFKKETSSPELLDKNHNIKEVEYPNLALNQLLQQKSKISLQGSLRWKTYLFPLTDALASSPKNHTLNILDLTWLMKTKKGLIGHINQVSGKTYLKVLKKWQRLIQL